MLSGDQKTVDITGSSNDNLCDSLAMNFESTRIVVGTRRNDDTGNIKIYNYDPFDSGTGTANTWVLAQTITGNSSSKFGKSADMNYDGNRIVVGAPGENKVYVYDATSNSANEWATYVSNTLTGTSSSDFGWSVSIAKDNPTKLAIGSPSENKAYMYELSGSTWSQTWSNVATDVPNKIPLTASTDAYMDSNNASYGYSVDLATFGRFLAIGAPGVLTTITSANSTYTGGSTIGDIYYDIGERIYGIAKTGNIFQRGYIRCFTTSNVSATWQNSLGGSGTTGLGEVTQHGQLVYGSTICHLGNWPGLNNTDSWSLPGLGFSVSISFDGSKLVGGEPFFSVPGHQASIHKGKARAWVYDNTRTSDKFQELTSSAATWFGDKFGYAVKLDYDGGRLAVGSTKRESGGSANESEDHGGVHVFDFSETAFYEVSQGNNDFSDTDVSHVAIAITNGKTVACGVRNYTLDDDGNPPTDSGKVRFYHMILTQTIIGNTLTGGYLAADSVYIGPNDNLEDNSFRKRLSFGGTFNDNKYEAAEIENRSFSTDLAHEGHSELFIVKKSVGSGGTGGRDMIRLKANEIQIHNYVTRGHDGDDNKHDMFPRLTMSEDGNFKLNPEFLYGRQNSSTYSSCDVKALLDINGDTFCRGKLNAGHKDRSNTRGLTRELGILFYDTRDRDIINGTTVYSNVHMTELKRQFNTGTITNTVTYNDTESAFKIGTSTSRIHSTVGGYTHNHEGLKLACWIKLTKDHDQYDANGETILSAGNLSGHYSKCQIYSGGVQILYNSGYKLQKSVTFTKDRWYHLFFYLNARQDTPTTGNNYLWIDSVSQTLSGNTSGGSASAPSSATDNFYVGSTSGSIVDAYIGMVHARNTNNGQSYILDATDLYNNGPPSERLSVGGDAIIENKLGVGTVTPSYEIDVDGTISSSNVVLAGGSSVESTPYYFTVTVNGSSKFVIDGTQQPTVTLYRGVTYRFDQADSSNGSHPFRISTTAEGGDASGTSYNGSNGSSGSYRQFIVPLDAPDTMYYNCSSHSSMGGTLRILSGIVTTNGVASSNVFVNNHMGIGIQTPKGPLHIHESTGSSHSAGYGTLVLEHGDSGGSSCIIFPSKKNYGSDYGYIQYEDSTSGTNELSRLIFGTQNDGAGSTADNIILSPSASVGIGTDTPTQAKLVVNGSVSTSLSYGWLNSSGNTGTASGSNPYSIYANQRIAGVEFNAHSDSRIKKNVVDINDSSALDKIRLLEPKIYNYIDEKQRGTSNVYGFIAQEVANVLPYAVTVSTGDIPNILTNSNVSVTSDSNVLELRLDTTVEGLTLSNTSNINITTDKNKYLTVPVLTFSGSNVITIQNSDTFSNVTGAYIHGEQVSNFNHLNKDAIWAVSTAALQEVDRQLQAEKTKVATLQTQVADLLTRVTALENN